ncbi:ashwin [Synchiropus splendidus]|uniref:ashwin n=1 Tax=Synchiropus splendidus TaxID=270530 RepID=UPI00237E5709|nr:ashwin [Synchiropus splendidus]
MSAANMASSNVKDVTCGHKSDVDVLLHPELLSKDFLLLLLREKKVMTGECVNRDQLTELFVRHVIPLPQRNLPDNRWGRRMERSRANADHQRPSQPFSPKIQSPDRNTGSTVDRLKPPPAVNMSNPIRRLSSNTPSSPTSLQNSARGSDSVSLKREANNSGELKPPEAKKKIQHVTWP